jgi:phosphatidylglycerophosphatase A
VVRPAAPGPRFLFAHPAHFIALGAGAGLAPFAPGTFGTLLAFPIHYWLAPLVPPYAWLGALAALFVLGIWACGRTGRALGVADHGGMVWDETVAFLLVLFFTPASLVWQAWAFLLFRLFDILKPPPIRYFDRKWKTGFGVMFDDLLAAGYALLALAVAMLLLR